MTTVLMVTKLGRMVTNLDGLLPIRDTLKSLDLHYHSAYSHQTWQPRALP